MFLTREETRARVAHAQSWIKEHPKVIYCWPFQGWCIWCVVVFVSFKMSKLMSPIFTRTENQLHDSYIIFCWVDVTVQPCIRGDASSFTTLIKVNRCLYLDSWLRERILQTIHLVAAVRWNICKPRGVEVSLLPLHGPSASRLQIDKSILCLLSAFIVESRSGPHQANLVHMAYASSEGSGEPAHPRSLARTSAARPYKRWVKRAFRQKARSLAPLNSWACAVKNCHDGMLEDTNSLEAPHLK